MRMFLFVVLLSESNNLDDRDMNEGFPNETVTTIFVFLNEIFWFPRKRDLHEDNSVIP